jgi:hypothetical protein
VVTCAPALADPTGNGALTPADLEFARNGKAKTPTATLAAKVVVRCLPLGAEESTL